MNIYGLGDRTLNQLMSEMLALLDGCENTRANAYRHLSAAIIHQFQRPLTIGSKRLYTLASEATRLGHYHSVVHLPTQSISSKNLVKVNNAKGDFATTNG
ncbi:hypothetical protein T05_9376 [Trichinella murrelli]|uniref:Uncharacterized protein n=1 Tax=Trichinella murrelli TaxID=144512 RepID=A0A0V0T6V2_9BILA|nr:hypothetical protein T05_9376 [Trichinella murrelli]